jgi:hypothetical protein
MIFSDLNDLGDGSRQPFFLPLKSANSAVDFNHRSNHAGRSRERSRRKSWPICGSEFVPAKVKIREINPEKIAPKPAFDARTGTIPFATDLDRKGLTLPLWDYLGVGHDVMLSARGLFTVLAPTAGLYPSPKAGPRRSEEAIYGQRYRRDYGQCAKSCRYPE